MSFLVCDYSFYILAISRAISVLFISMITIILLSDAFAFASRVESSTQSALKVFSQYFQLDLNKTNWL